jgi:hypothetical protein
MRNTSFVHAIRMRFPSAGGDPSRILRRSCLLAALCVLAGAACASESTGSGDDTEATGTATGGVSGVGVAGAAGVDPWLEGPTGGWLVASGGVYVVQGGTPGWDQLATGGTGAYLATGGTYNGGASWWWDSGPCPDVDPTVVGQLENDVATLDYTAGILRVHIEHKQDVDVADGGGCIAYVSIELRQDTGCELFLSFSPGASDQTLELDYAYLRADSMCPNWRDSDEGYYLWERGGTTGTLDLSDTTVQDGALAESCLSAPLEPKGVIRLTRSDGREVALDLSDIAVSGDLPTVGFEDACCPGLDCTAPDRWDAG